MHPPQVRASVLELVDAGHKACQIARIKSKDIIDLFTSACELVGVERRVTCWRGSWRVRINRRRSVELMLANVGLKS